ncbi:hypothetical protein G9464_11000 [Halostella sp. JP-L12]|uniref:DUF6612 family protein n=1 Tax=Halostella TaxID=1843185 RepID=UPI000EF7BFF6|nr:MULTISPECIES: DUF6612 family protein [Halostella]NHN48124.1 hypothetical protein [Halostella sp. JP-L12]
MDIPKRFVTVALIALLVAGAGCAGLTGGDAAGDDDGAEQYDNATAVQEAATEQMQDVESYTFTMEMSMVSDNMTMNSTSEGAADIADRRLRQNQTITMQTQGRNMTINSTSYMIGDTMYSSYDGGAWQTMNLSEMPGGMGVDDMWNQSDTMEQQEALLNGSEVSFGDEKTTTIDGQEVYVIEMDIDEEGFTNLTNQQMMSDAQQQQAMSDVNYSEISITQYVDTESMYVVKTEMSLEMTTNGQTMRQEMVMTFDNFNEDLTIEAPVDDANATVAP